MGLLAPLVTNEGVPAAGISDLLKLPIRLLDPYAALHFELAAIGIVEANFEPAWSVAEDEESEIGTTLAPCIGRVDGHRQDSSVPDIPVPVGDGLERRLFPGWTREYWHI